jgi:hypothetical protein
MRSAKIAAACLVACSLALLARPVSAYPYCRKTTCGDCPLDPTTGCPTGGRPLFWRRSCVGFSLNIAGGDQIDFDTATSYAHQAFETWNAVTCPQAGGAPTPLPIRAKNIGPVDCAHIEYNSDGPNANIIVFRQGTWPYPGDAVNALAFTTVTFDSETGEILDADMEINGLNEFLVPGMKGSVEDYDLPTIMTHEAGHFFGLAHSLEYNSVMQPVVPPRVQRTTLGQVDIDGICAIYPPPAHPIACDYAPNGGFSPQCSLDPSVGGTCSMAPPQGHGNPSRFALALAVAAALAAPFALRRRGAVRPG